MLAGLTVECVDLQEQNQFAGVRDFLGRFDLSFTHDVEYTVVLRKAGEIVGTGSFAGEVLRNIAVDEQLQGCGLTSTIITELVQEQARRGRTHYFIFTKPDTAGRFADLGFREIACAKPYAVLLESGLGSVTAYCQGIQKQIAHREGDVRAAIVANCNPFTEGHRYLIRQAAAENDSVIVFIVSEDRSLFPFADRIKLAKEGVADLANVVVVPTDRYIVSAATFPTYFTHAASAQVIAQTRLDATLFAEQIAPRLGIKARYVGDEPYCLVTNQYNGAMLDILPRRGVEVKVIKRMEVGGAIVSASQVRDMIRCGVWDEVKKLVPNTTYRYLVAADALARERINVKESPL